MGLFFDVLSAINNPNQTASVDQLSGVMNSLQQAASSNGVNPATMQNALSGLGSALRPALQQQASAPGGLGGLVGQLAQAAGGAGGAGNFGAGDLGSLAAGAGGLGALSSLLTPELQQQLIQAVTQKSGMNAGMVQAMLPALLPAVMQFLNMGSGKPGSGLTSNPLLQSFLDSDRDQDVDLGDAFRFASRFLNPPR